LQRQKKEDRKREEEAAAEALTKEEEEKKKKATAREEAATSEPRVGNSRLVDMKSLLADAASAVGPSAPAAPTFGQGLLAIDSDSGSGSDDDNEDADSNADSILSDPFSQLLASSFSNINMVKVAGDLEASFAGGSASSTGNMLSKNLREAREQAKVVAKYSEPLCALYRRLMKKSEADWGAGAILWEDFTAFAQEAGIVPELVSPFELQVLFQDNADAGADGEESIAECQLAECLIQCIRTHSSNWTHASEQLDELL